MLRCAEAAPSFHHLHDAALDHVGGAEALDALAAQLDRALRDRAALARQQVADGAQRRRLAGAVAAHQGDDAPFVDLQRHALEHQDHVVVDDLDAVDVEEDGARGPSALGVRSCCLAAHDALQVWQSSGVRRVSFFSSA